MSEKDGIVRLLEDDKKTLTVCNNSGRGEFEITTEELEGPEAALFWSNPNGVMNVVFKPGANSRCTKFNLRLKNTHNIESDVQLYRVLNRKETPIEKNEEDVVLECDIHYEVVVKVCVPSDSECYGVALPYAIEPQAKVQFSTAATKATTTTTTTAAMPTKPKK